MNVPAIHSPAPWRFCIDGEMDDYCNIQKVDAPLNFSAIGYGNNPSIIDANGDTVVGCSEYNVFASRNQSANVALMLAAPELLAALEKALASIEGQAELLRHCGAAYGVGSTLAQARAAIARATATQ